jgi:methanogenic corrinoid protein MtbC1
VQSDALEKLKKSLLELDRAGTLQAARAVLEERAADAQAGVEAINDALEVVGRHLQEGKWYLGELVYSGEIAKETTELLSPHLSTEAGEGLGIVVVGTVAGDMHDLGKNIFNTYAKGAGLQVVDLGTDVSAEQFAAAARKHRPVALGLSCLLTTCAGGVGRVIEELQRHGLREASNVIVGGAALTEDFAREIGADAFAPDAVTGTEIIRAWSES